VFTIIIAAQHSVPVFASVAITLKSRMTSFIVEAHVDRHIHPEWADNPECAFCLILRNELSAHILYEDEKVVVILGRSPYSVELEAEALNVGKDIAPLRPGHTLVIPKLHHKYISELPEEYAAALGLVVTRVAKALTKGSVTDQRSQLYDLLTCAVVLENPGLNVVGNQEYAQAVPHVRVRCLPTLRGRWGIIF